MATRLIVEDDRFNFDYCHFLPWHASQCRSLHGHSSVITVMLRGEPDDQGFVIDFGEAKQLIKDTLGLFDHKLIAPRSAVLGPPDAQGLVAIAFETPAGPHRLFLPATEVAIIDSDATVENLARVPNVIPIDGPAADEFDRLRADKKLKKIGRADLLIAAITLANRATLVTRNLRDFRQVPGLQVENWVD